MDSPDFTNNNHTSSASTLNVPSSQSPQLPESPFLRFAKTLSPIKHVRACNVEQGFLGLNSPPPVFKSPRICYRETHFSERPQVTQSLSREISQSENGGNSLGEDPRYYNISNSQQPLSERFTTGTENGENTQNCSSLLSVDEYLADPEDIDRMYAADQDVEQSTDTALSSLGDLPRSMENLLKFDRKGGPEYEAVPLPMSEESNKFHQEKPAYDEEPEKKEGEKRDVGMASQEHTELESNLATDVFEKQYSHYSLPQCVEDKGWYYQYYIPQSMPCPLLDANEMVSTSHVTAENISQDDSESIMALVDAAYNLGEAASNALVSNKSHVKAITTLLPQRGSGNFPVTGSKPSGIGLYLNSIMNAKPAGRAATTGMRLSDGLQMLETKRKLSLTDAGKCEEFNQPEPCKKKKKTSSSGDDNGCRRCRCKKSKCLKLYCECLGAGIFCTDPCACQGCLNRPEYAEIVRETIHKIQSRNAMEDINQKTQSSAKHRRGCNCKTSKCVKSYCGCFQANVGCSSGCRCKGCKNMYGRKRDYVALERGLSKERVANMSDCNNMNMDELSASNAASVSSRTIEWKNIPPHRLSRGSVRRLSGSWKPQHPSRL